MTASILQRTAASSCFCNAHAFPSVVARDTKSSLHHCPGFGAGGRHRCAIFAQSIKSDLLLMSFSPGGSGVFASGAQHLGCRGSGTFHIGELPSLGLRALSIDRGADAFQKIAPCSIARKVKAVSISSAFSMLSDGREGR